MQPPTRIFLASSSELSAERALFQLRIGSKNKLWHGDGIFLHVDVWEDFIDCLSRTRSQDEYNAAIRQADIFVLLVHTKLGKYSREEFEAAFAQFNTTGKPRIYIYFKQPAHPAAPGPDYQTVRDLKAHLAQLDQFPPQPYEHVAEMLDHFNQQLDKLRDKGLIAEQTPQTSMAPATANVAGSGASAVGPNATAAGAGGVAIGGSAHGPVSVVNTQGGAMFYGPVKAHTVVGRDLFQAATPPSNADPALAQITQQLAALQAQLLPLATRPCKALVSELMQGLQTEAATPAAKREPGLMKHLLEGLVDLVPAGVGAVASAFASPVLGALAGPAAAAVLARVQGQAGASK